MWGSVHQPQKFKAIKWNTELIKNKEKYYPTDAYRHSLLSSDVI